MTEKVVFGLLFFFLLLPAVLCLFSSPVVAICGVIALCCWCYLCYIMWDEWRRGGRDFW